MRSHLALVLCLLSATAWAQTPRTEVPDWLFPRNPPAPANAPPADDTKPIHLSNSEAAFTAAQLLNRFSAPDWHPATHTPMPEVVAHGRPPKVFACGFCHMPQGQGRPENAPVAGLPAQYIIQQVEDFQSGARRGVAPNGYLPTDLMLQVAQCVTAEDLKTAAEYFAAQRMTRRTRVVETVRVPKMDVVGWVYAAGPSGATEPLGERLLEMTQDSEAHERRADGPLYITYVPKGSVARGKTLAHAPGAGCVTCHGEGLRGVGLIPPLAGRSPTYVLRQLLGFKTGARTGAAGGPMKTVVAQLQLNNMIDAAAYAGSLQP
jgi:cytochrome c553